MQLVKARDDRVVAALVVFLSDNNKEEFVDTLARIACLEVMKLKDVQEEVKQGESKEGHLVLAMLKELEEKGVMSEEEREQIEELVCSGEPRMLAAMDVLAATHDTDDFADTARRILSTRKDDTTVEKSEGESTEAAAGSPKANTAAITEEEGEAISVEAAKDTESDPQSRKTAPKRVLLLVD